MCPRPNPNPNPNPNPDPRLRDSLRHGCALDEALYPPPSCRTSAGRAPSLTSPLQASS